MQWQPIATAERDSTPRLLLMGGEFVSVGAWNAQASRVRPQPYWSSERGWLFGPAWDRGHQPTHWMPLPEVIYTPEKGE